LTLSLPTQIPVAGMTFVTNTLIVCAGSPAAVTVTVAEPFASASSVTFRVVWSTSTSTMAPGATVALNAIEAG